VAFYLREDFRAVTIDYNEIRELIKTLAATDISEFSLKSGDLELNIRKGTVNTALVPLPAPVSVVTPPPVAPVVASVTPVVETPTPEPAAPAIDKKWVAITSPMVGTFYRAPAPDEPSFVDKNDRIRIGQTVCIIEAMKLMNEIEAEVAGQIVEIAVANGEPVEFGQTLMWVNPE
jgi:acetyl-CoA carboxylase biotin carboxyl carrier protein